MKPQYKETNIGLEVHGFLGRGAEPPGSADDLVKLHFDKLVLLADALSLELMATEETGGLEQIWEIWPGILTHRIIDAIAFDYHNNEYVLVDWKTAWKKWAVVDGGSDSLIAPKAQTPQSAGYVFPPPDEMIAEAYEGLESWPSKLMYLVSPIRGRSQCFTYERNEEDEAYYIEALRFIKNFVVEKIYPRNRGTHCEWCDFQQVCYDVAGWEEVYESKDRRVRNRKGSRRK